MLNKIYIFNKMPAIYILFVSPIALKKKTLPYMCTNKSVIKVLILLLVPMKLFFISFLVCIFVEAKTKLSKLYNHLEPMRNWLKCWNKSLPNTLILSMAQLMGEF